MELDMGIINKVKDLFNSMNDDFEGDEMEFLSKENIFEERKELTRKRSDDRSKVVNINATAPLKVVLVKPEKFEEATAACDHLTDRKTIVLNLESTNKDASRRIVDFLSGATYAMGGNIKRIANSTFIITPYYVELMGDLIDELENNGVYF